MTDELAIQQPQAPQPRRRAVAVLDKIEPIVLAGLPVFMVVYSLLGLPNAALVTAVAAIASLVPFFARFELSHLRARDIMPIVVLSALGVAGRLIFAPIPAIKPVTAIVIITGIAFGRQSAFLTGALTMLVSNIFFGQGPWTPWQMYSMGLVGYLSGFAADHGLLNRRWVIIVFGFAMVYVYGGILDTWTLLGFVAEITPQSIATTYFAGFTYNLGHAVGTVVFLLPIAVSWPKMFGRIKTKYGITGPDTSRRGRKAEAFNDAEAVR